MSRPASTETQLKNAIRQIRALQADLARMRQEMTMYKSRSEVLAKDRSIARAIRIYKIRKQQRWLALSDRMRKMAGLTPVCMLLS